MPSGLFVDRFRKLLRLPRPRRFKPRDSHGLSRVLAALTLAGLCGCEGRPENIGAVTGTVTLDGQPLADARVTFTPRGGQTNSLGTTDANGRYSLVYSRHHQGAEIGEHSVSISTFVPANPDFEPPAVRVPERIPSMYNHQSTLTAKVESGSNTIHFNLSSNGPVVQPDQIPDASE